MSRIENGLRGVHALESNEEENTLKRIIIGVVLGALSLGAVAFAQDDKKGRVGQRQENQQQRIDKGVQDGSLNSREAARLEAGEAALDRKIARDKQDGGGFTNREKRQAERRQDNMSKRIHRQRHDKQTQK